MPSIAQQDYIIIAPKEGRAIADDAAAMGQLKRAVLNGTAFDRLLKDPISTETGLTRVVYIYETDGASVVALINPENDAVHNLLPEYTPDQYSGLAAIQQALDAKYGLQELIPNLTTSGGDTPLLQEDSEGRYICVDNKYLIVGEEIVTAITIAETGPGEGDEFINITWDAAQKLIGLPLI